MTPGNLEAMRTRALIAAQPIQPLTPRLPLGATPFRAPPMAVQPTSATLYENPQQYLSEKIQGDLEEDVAEFIGAPSYEPIGLLSNDPVMSELTSGATGLFSNVRHGITSALTTDQIAQNIAGAIDPFNLGYGQVIGRPVGILGANVLGFGHEVFGSGGLFQKSTLEDLAANLAGSVYGFQNPGFAQSYADNPEIQGRNFLSNLLSEGILQNFLKSDMFDVTEEYRRANKLTDALNLETDKLLKQFREEKIEQDSVMDKIAATRSRALTDAQAAQARREAARRGRKTSSGLDKARERSKDAAAAATGKSRGYFGGR